jgi:hypothetical protein
MTLPIKVLNSLAGIPVDGLLQIKSSKVNTVPFFRLRLVYTDRLLVIFYTYQLCRKN